MLGFLDLDAGDLKGHELQHGEISKMFNKKKQSICTCFVCNCTSTHCIAWMLKIMVLQSGLINNWIQYVQRTQKMISSTSKMILVQRGLTADIEWCP